MKKICSSFALVIFLLSAKHGLAQADFGSGVKSAITNFGLDELVKEAKRSDPNSDLPSIIEHMLAGISLATDPTTILKETYPGFLAANAIGQLVEMHGEDIAKMSYSERKVFIGDEYGDPSLIPRIRKSAPEDSVKSMCFAMFNVDGGAYADCTKYVSKIRTCNANSQPTKLQASHCKSYLQEFYEHMEYEGKNSLVRKAGTISQLELVKAASESRSSNGGSKRGGFDWVALGTIDRFCSAELECGGGFPKCTENLKGAVIQDRRGHNNCVAQGCESGSQYSYPTFVCEQN